MAGKLPCSLKLTNVVTSDDENSDEGSNDGGDEILGLLSFDKLNLGKRKKLIVLSLGGFLAHRVYRREKASVRGYSPDSVLGNFLVFKRPFCTEFLSFCFERFEVGMWSSAREHNLDAALSCILGGLRRKFAFVWDHDECTDSGFSSLENKHKPILLKELRKVWDNSNGSLSWRNGPYSAANTLLICDPTAALLNPPNTAIFPMDYKVDNRNDTFLGPRGDMRVFLDGLADADDVPSYVKEHPLGLPAITSTHPDWNYYSRIVRKFSNGKAAT